MSSVSSMLSPMTSSSAAPPLPSSLVTFASVNVDVNKKAEKLDHNCQVHCQASQFQVSFQGLSFACSPCLCHNRPTNPCHVFNIGLHVTPTRPQLTKNCLQLTKNLSQRAPSLWCHHSFDPSCLCSQMPMTAWLLFDCLTAAASKQRSCRRRERAKRVAGRAYWHTGTWGRAYWHTGVLV